MPPPTKRRKTSKIEEITFDFAAREDYLTGFHKRKQARIKHAQEEAARREREERITQRKQLREQRKVDLEKHVQEVNALLKKANDDLEDGDGEEGAGEFGDELETEEWGGFEESPAVSREDEYVDEDKYTTVTVESVDISKDGFHRVGDEEASEEDSTDDQPKNAAAVNGRDPASGKRVWTREKPITAKPKKKKKKFRYESKAERKVTRMKQSSKNREQAKARRG